MFGLSGFRRASSLRQISRQHQAGSEPTGSLVGSASRTRTGPSAALERRPSPFSAVVRNPGGASSLVVGTSNCVIQMARRKTLRRDLFELRRLGPAPHAGVPAARVEVAAGRRLERRRDLALDRLERALRAAEP